ncbi:MAG: hypothetical protein HXX18_09010 [Bacteroidetes bacterium]|nr:hypothetical protein [Bacteroidota bacterium]
MNKFFLVFILIALLVPMKGITQTSKVSKKYVLDTNSFKYKSLKTTFNQIDEGNIQTFKSLSNYEKSKWLKSLVPKYAQEMFIKYGKYKKLAYQYKTKRYYCFILAIQVSEAIDQFLITVDSTGNYIDGLNIRLRLSLSNFEAVYDSTFKLYSQASTKESILNGNKKFVYEQLILTKTSNEEEDVIKDGYCETAYEINEIGKIICNYNRKEILELPEDIKPLFPKE